MTKTVSPFIENTEGILTHNGEIKVAKGGVKQKYWISVMKEMFW